jgi:uncharacterized protein (DUF934 family)
MAMATILKGQALIEDPWTQPEEAAVEGRPRLWSLEGWLGPREGAWAWGEGVLLRAEEDVWRLSGRLEGLVLVAVAFESFRDGRGCSQAQMLRQHLGWSGSLRAQGDVLCDQMFSLARCGFDEFGLRADQSVEACVAALSRFSVRYQGASDEGLPLYRRAALG